MRKHIMEVIKAIEKEYGVEVIYACEAGSRAWGYANEDSDFDVKFIYIHPVEWYLSIDSYRDVLEIPKHDTLTFPIHKDLDMSGWEITKALRLFRKWNPSLLEWLFSSTVYYEQNDLIKTLRQFSKTHFSAPSCYYHYFHMAKRNHVGLNKANGNSVKSYLNILRPLLASMWIETYHSFPPVEFKKLVSELIESEELLYAIQNLLHLKMEKHEIAEMYLEPINDFINRKINELELTLLENRELDSTDLTGALNTIFRETLGEAWRI